MLKDDPESKPAILSFDAQKLIDKYKGTGYINKNKCSDYPTEIIDADMIVGKTWITSQGKYIETKRFKIFYSSKGVHIVPVNDFKKLKRG
jgi:hypothetical protein